MRVVGMDPGLASFGWCVADVADEISILELGVWRTEPSKTKSAIRGTSDVAERVAYLMRSVAELVERTQPSALCMEDFSPPRSSSAAAKVARVFGMLDAVAEYEGLASLRVTPQEIKLAMCGRRGASKDAVQAEVFRWCTASALEQLEGNAPKSQHNHAFDAGGAVLASKHHPVMLILMRGGR
jgi:crossover junction endodeoxyribonuclease RuvC